MNIRPTPPRPSLGNRVVFRRCSVCRWRMHEPALDGICRFCKDEFKRGEKPKQKSYSLTKS